MVNTFHGRYAFYGIKKLHNPFLSSGLYRRPRNHTGSAAASTAGRGLVAMPFTAGGELHPALKQTF